MSTSLKVVLKRILYYLPVAILFLILYSQLVAFERSEILEQVEKENRIHLKYIQTATNREFTIFYRVMEFLRASDWVDYYLSDTTLYEAEVKNLFNGVLLNQQSIQYVTFFSNDGKSSITSAQKGREEKDFSLATYNLTVDKLMDEVSLLQQNEIYLHPVTFKKDPLTNVYEQMVLLASPVIRDGKVTGILVFSLQVHDSFSIIDDFMQDHSHVLTFTILEGNGNVLKRSTRFESVDYETEITDFAETHPIVWEAIVEKGEGRVEVDDTLYQFTAIDPFLGLSSYYEHHEHYFIAMSSFPLSQLELIQSSFLLRNEPLRYIIALLILFSSVIISLLMYFRKNDRELIALSNIISDQSHDGVLIRKPSGEVTYCNYAVELLTGFSEEEILLNRLVIDFIKTSSTMEMRKKTQYKISSKQVVSYDDFVWLHSKNSYTLNHMLMNNVFNNQQQLLYLVQLLSDPQNLSQESFDNFILQNRTETALIDEFPISVMEELDARHHLFAIMYLKLTNLDILEAQFTHAQHYQLGNIIRNNLISILEKNEELFQCSPDTFLITLSGDSESIEKKTLKLQQIFESPIGILQNKKVITYQCGVAMHEEEKTIASLITDARMALATQLHFNKKGVLIYDRSINESLLRYYSILKKIPLAFEKGEIEVFLQPFVGTVSSSIVGAEALVRWDDEELGFISPLEFIPIIENHRLEHLLDFYVIEKVAECIASIETLDDTFFISVNLCPPILFNEQLIPHLVHTLSKYNVEHKRVVIELTERTLLEDLHRANAILAELHNLGFHIAIDDFGTGFSSLSYLNMLDIDIVKIDQAFIKDYPNNNEGKIMKAILTMARELEIYTFVEGIETQEQLTLIIEHQADAYQGYLFSKAVSLSDFKALYNEHAPKKGKIGQ